MKNTQIKNKPIPSVHTVDELESQQEGVTYEEAFEDAQSEDDATSVGTDAGELGATLLQHSLHCGSRYVHRKNEQDYVCFGRPKCRREGHAQAPKGLEGVYQVEKDGKALGAPVSTYMSVETYHSIQERNRVNNRAAMEAMARGDTKKAADLFDMNRGEESSNEKGDSFAGKLKEARARMAEAESFLTGSKTNAFPKNNVADTVAAGPAKEEGNAAAKRSPFNSPLPHQAPVDHFAALAPSSTNSTLDTGSGSSPGMALKSKFINATTAPDSTSIQQEIAPLVDMFTSQMNTMQEGMVKLQEKLASLETTEPDKNRKGRNKKKSRRRKKHYSSSSSSSATSSSESERPPPILKNHRPATNTYHAVANGKEGMNNVYLSAEEALPLVVGIPGAQYQRFQECNEAWRWVFSQDRKTQPPTGTSGSLEADNPGQAITQSWCQPVGPVEGNQPWESSRAPAKAFSNPVPPPVLPTTVLGSDPSMKKKDEAFGINLNKDVGSIRKAFCPPGVNSQTMKDLCGSMLDVVSLPGKSVSVSSEEVAQLSETLGEVLQQRAEALNQDIRKDLNWKSDNRIALKRITNSTDLREMVSDVNTDKEDEMNKVMNNTITILSRYPWEEHVLEAWKTHGYITRMSRDSLDCYYSLLQRLQYVDTNSGWKEAKQEIQFHLKKLSRIRGSASNREECMFKTYTYLRDARAADWASPKLDRAKIESIQKELQAFRSQSNSWVCPKCKQSIVHGPDAPCPFKDKSNEEAKKLGKAILKALGEG